MKNRTINIKLLKAIGWRSEDIRTPDWLRDAVMLRWCGGERIFDYTNWYDIAPIAERYDCFPMRGFHSAWATATENGGSGEADTPQKAIALAVINGATK